MKTTVQIDSELLYEVKKRALMRRIKVWEWTAEAILFKLKSEGIFLNDVLSNNFGE